MLKGLRVLEFQGLAPSVFCGMYFADQGAQVILIARPQPAPFSMEIHSNIMNRNKKCIALSLKNQNDKNIITQLIKTTDVIIDPYRPGVLQKQGFGPQALYSINPKVILLRVTGYGQHGEMALKPGHDLNYIASSGILKLINESQKEMQFPANYLADFVSASLGIVGTLKALANRKVSAQGLVVDCSLAGGCSYLTHIVQNQKEKLKILRNNTQKIFEKNGKRYVATVYGSEDKNIETKIQSQIQKMQTEKKDFFKNEEFEIAQIKKISKIANSKLGNPFDPENNQTLNKIPTRDQNRQQILSTLSQKNVTNLPKL